jgi:hypothetical protein
MKRLTIIIACLLLTAAFYANSQIYHSYDSDHYHVVTDKSVAFSQEVALKMEAAIAMFNDTMHFELTELPAKLKLTIFQSKDAFNNYLNNLIKETREDFAYIHYSDPTKSELVGFQKEKEEDFNSSLLHQGFIQFIKTFVPNPPIWMREGLATYFENSEWNETTKTFIFKPNFIWLKNLKSIVQNFDVTKPYIPLDELLTISKDSATSRIETFYPQAWGLVSFLLESEDNNYNRIFYDAVSNLDTESDLSENSVTIKNSVFSWIEMNKIEQDYVSYILSLKTFNELVQEGINQFTIDEYNAANQNFSKALELEPDNYISYYYLGLINYSTENYLEAESYYQQALSLGSDEGVTKYAIGVNYFANNQFEKAVSYLNEAKTADPDNYSEKVDTLLLRINTR